MKTQWKASAGIALVFVLIAAATAFSGINEGTVGDPAFEKKARPVVSFDHGAHMDYAGVEDCNTCHHVFDEDGVFLEDESSEDSSCSECHLEDGADTMELMAAYHDRCITCHTNEQAGPVTCNACHAKP